MPGEHEWERSLETGGPLPGAASHARGSRLALRLLLAAIAALLITPASASAIADGKIKGKVTAKVGGAPIVGLAVCVQGYEPEYHYECQDTEAKGEYDFEVPAESYVVYFSDETCPKAEECEPINWVAQYYDEQPSEYTAEPVTVESGKTITLVNAEMVKGATFEGQVTAQGGRELEGVEVCAQPEDYEYYETCGYTEEEGYFYLVGLPAGEFVISYTGGYQCPPEALTCLNLNYVKQFYDDQGSEEAATRVKAAVGEERTGLGAVMKEGEKIEGTVTAAAGGAPLDDVRVCPRSIGSSPEGECAYPNKEGKYVLEGLDGEYGVIFTSNSASFVSQFFEGTTVFSAMRKLSATTPGATIAGVNARLLAPGEITGVVTVAPSGAPVAGVEVCAVTEDDYFRKCAHTNATGDYAIGEVAGSYIVEFLGSESCEKGCHSLPYVDQYYHGIYLEKNAEQVVVGAGATVTGINARLAESVEQGVTETLLRRQAEEAKRAEEAKKAEEARKAEEAKKAEEARGKAEAEHKKAEEAIAKAAQAVLATLKIERIKVTARTVLLTLKLSKADTLTVSGTDLKRTVAKLATGTHVVKVALTPAGRTARVHRKTLTMILQVKIGAVTASLTKRLRL